MTKKQPNVIVFFTDQQRWDTTGVHGNPLGLTPNFDRMANEGTHVMNSFTCQPVCGPARSSLQTGLYATSNGCYRNDIPLARSHKTLAHYFKESGYETSYLGKWHLAGSEPVPEEERGGYERWLGANALELCSDAYKTILYNNENEEVHLPGYRVDAMTDEAIRYVTKEKEKPYFLFISYLEPHHQNHLDNYPAPDGYEEKYTGMWTPPDLAALGGTSAQHLGGYYGMVKKLDEALGRLMDALKSTDQSEDTIILFTSDHANHFKTRNAEYKRSCHESSIRVPTALIGPGFNGGGRIQELVSLIDLPPTLLDGAGIQVPEVMEGKSILPLTKGKNEDWHEEVFVQISESQVGRAIRTKRWKYSIIAHDKHPWNDSYADEYTEDCLYDLHADPYELANCIHLDGFAEVAKEMRQRMKQKILTVEGKTPIIHEAEKLPSGHRMPSIH